MSSLLGHCSPPPPPVGRAVGEVCFLIGMLGVMQDRTWAPIVAALGGVAWPVGHWGFAVRYEVHYRSRVARAVIVSTSLRWKIPRCRQLRLQWGG